MNQIAILGASGCGRGVLPLVRMQLSKGETAHELVFVDDNPQLNEINDHKILTYEQWLQRPGCGHFINIAIANSRIRERLVKRCESDGIEFFEVRAENVIQLDNVSIGVGAILCPFVTLTSNIRIGRHFHANIYSYVEHDCVIGDYVTFAPAVKCNGNVHIEDHVYVGAGAVIKQGSPDNPLIIGEGAVIGMGAVVTKSIPAGMTVVGNPAKHYLKKN